MINNFELIKDFTNVRDFAVCMSKNDICCDRCKIMCCRDNYPPSQMETECRRCWLDFLTSDEGLDLSYLDKDEPIESKTSSIRNL